MKGKAHALVVGEGVATVAGERDAAEPLKGGAAVALWVGRARSYHTWALIPTI